MYTPAAFAVTDQSALHSFIELNSFGTLVTCGEQGSVASHVPFLLDRSVGPNGHLHGHWARANEQVPADSADGQEVLVIFHGPHAYVSPAWYAVRDVVPTWNYVAVHVYGRMRLIIDPDQSLALLRRMVDRYEGDRAVPWTLDSADPAFVQRLVGAIVAFEVEITRIEGKWKLSQNHDRARRERVVEGLKATGSADAAEIARLMTEQLAAGEG